MVNYIILKLTRGGVAVTRWAHNPKIVGSNPTLAILNFMKSFINFKFFEHTADIGIILEEKTLEKLIEKIILVFSDLTTDLSKLGNSINMRISISADNLEDMIIRLLEEVIFLFETKKFLPSECSVILKNTSVTCDMKGDMFDTSRHPSKFVIKAITYHQFNIKKDKNRWILKAVFDV